MRQKEAGTNLKIRFATDSRINERPKIRFFRKFQKNEQYKKRIVRFFSNFSNLNDFCLDFFFHCFLKYLLKFCSILL